MTNLIKTAQTMDSREIAELTGKRHADVIRDIESQLSRIGDERNFASVYKARNGEDRKCYALPYRETMILVSGYSVELRARVIDRWLSLERKEAARSRAHQESKKMRQGMTEQWRLHGASKPHEFINLTFAEYKALGYEKPRETKKANMTMEELARLAVLESIETYKLIMNPEITGYSALAESVQKTGYHLPMHLDCMIAGRVSA